MRLNKTRRKRLGKMLKVFRQQLDLSQKELATEMGYKNAQYISNIERGLCNVPDSYYTLLSNKASHQDSEELEMGVKRLYAYHIQELFS